MAMSQADELSAGFSEFLGLNRSESLELSNYVLSLKSRTLFIDHLASLLPPHSEPAKKFIHKWANVLFPITPAPKQEPPAPKDAPQAKSKPKYPQRQIAYTVTGNEPGAALEVLNCLSCGFIYKVNDYEAMSLCSFCNQPMGKKIRKAHRSESAVRHKDRLVRFDKTAAERTKVLDDQSDYFVSTIDSKWSTAKEKDEARKEKDRVEEEIAEQRRQIHLALDPKSKQFVQVDPNLSESAAKVYDALKRRL